MKIILLLGDSIRYGAPGSPGYGKIVKEKLEGKANVFAPDDNCRFVQYTLRYLYNWARDLEDVKEKIDVIHWNNGLWDVLRLNGDEPLTPVDMYVYFLKRVYNMLTKLFPNAKIVFALTTPVQEDMANPTFMRYNSDIEEYNKAAKEFMDSVGVCVNDFYSVIKPYGKDVHSDWVHFNERGCEILADAVIEKVM